MDVIIIMCLGVLAGRFFFKSSHKKNKRNHLCYLHRSFNFQYGRNIRQK